MAPIPGIDGILELVSEQYLSYWHRLVSKYSTTNLSRASDLLIALAGLTKPLQDSYQFTQSFAIWTDFIL